MRWKCICQYDGTEFSGWQSQPDLNSVQDHLERRLEQIFDRKLKIYGSGRTDAGVHARGQVFHFDAEWKHENKELLHACRCGIPPTIRITSIEKVDSSFNARFSIKRKCYKYYLLEDFASAFNFRHNWCFGYRRLNCELMQAAANQFCGEHNFSAFCANRNDGKEYNPIKTIYAMNFQKNGPQIIFTTIGSGYLYKMVRIILGSLVMVGLNKISIKDLTNMLTLGRRNINIEVAPANGLFLEYVEY